MPLDGLQLDHYRLLRLLGSGGMGEVYLAEDTRIMRHVAVKVIRSEVIPYPDANTVREANRLFQREARAIATLQHPHILPLFDYGEERVQGNTFTYMVMPYCQAGSLDMWLRQREDAPYLSPQDVAQIVEQAADALQHAHRQQIIHQDVKPSNFLIRGWKTQSIPDLVLADFGVAKFVSANSSTSQSIRGTPTYMAPEQWEGRPVPATDQYALAIMVYQLLTGYLPFQGGPGQIMYQHFSVQPQPPSTHRPELPSAIDTVVLRALMKRPEGRFDSVAAFARAFHQTLQATPLPSISTPEPHGDHPISRIPTVNKEEEIATFLVDSNRTVISSPAMSASRGTPVEPGLAVASKQDTTRDGNRTAVSSAGSLSRQYQRTSQVKKVFIALPILLLIVAMSGAFYFVTRSPSQYSSAPVATATNQAGVSNNTTMNGTAMAAAQANADATHVAATVQANADATHVAATVQAQTANATATAQAAAFQNPYPPNRGALALEDPLVDNSKGYSWEEGARDQGYCTFTGGAYHSIISLNGYFHSCLASLDFNNFAFEVQMNILSGNTGGIVFRASRATTQFYYFLVDRAGNYHLQVYYDKNGDYTPLASGSSAPLRGNDLIGVVAQGSTIRLYVNRQLIQEVSDTTYTHGQLGVFALSGEASFSNARVWTL